MEQALTPTPGRPAGSPRASEKSQARRDELLAGLRDLFLAEGFLAFGIGDLAERLRCSRSTLYAVAPTKEQIVLTVVRGWFRDAAESVESAIEASHDPVERIELYLRAVARALGPASARFHADLQAYAPAGEVYRQNTELAGRRVQGLVSDGVRDGVLREVDAVFVGAVASQVMRAIQSGEMADATGLDDAEAYERLASLLLHGLRAPTADPA